MFTATYEKEDLVITVTYAETKETMYVATTLGLPLSQHLYDDVEQYSHIINVEDGYTAERGDITNTTWHMVELTNEFGDSYVIQLKNGHFIVIDGGHGDKESKYENQAPVLINYLKSLTKDDKKPIVEAWIITHAHSDHAGVLAALANNAGLASQIYVDGLYFNEPSEDVIKTDGNGTVKYHINGIKQVADIFKSSSSTEANIVHPKIYRPQMGQKYFFVGGVSFEVVLTQEQIPFDYYTYDVEDGDSFTGDNFNESSTWFMFYFAEGNQTYKLLYGADGGPAAMTIAMDVYNDSYFEVNVHHLFHHGQNHLDAFNNILKKKVNDLFLLTRKTSYMLIGWSSDWGTKTRDLVNSSGKSCYAYNNGGNVLIFKEAKIDVETGK